MNYTENQTRSKAEIKNSFLTFFKIQDVTHLAAQKLKEIKQRPGESVREYDKRFKDLLSQIPTTIDQNLLVQWYVVGLLPRIHSPLRLYEITYCEDALTEAQRVESDDDGPSTSSTTERLEEKIEHLQQTIKNLSIRRNEVWCTTCLGKDIQRIIVPSMSTHQQQTSTEYKLKNIVTYVNA
jgi:hypothetical protein